MKKLLWSLTLFGVFLILPVNGVMEYDKMEKFTDFNGTNVYQTENDVNSKAKVTMVGLTLIKNAALRSAGNIFYNTIWFIEPYPLIICFLLLTFLNIDSLYHSNSIFYYCSVSRWKSCWLSFSSRFWFRSKELARSFGGLLHHKDKSLLIDVNNISRTWFHLMFW